MKELLADWKLLLALAGGSLAAILLIVYAFVRPAVDPAAEERKRRLHLNLIGRIAEGQVVELAEHPAPVVEARWRLLGFAATPVGGQWTTPPGVL